MFSSEELQTRSYSVPTTPVYLAAANTRNIKTSTSHPINISWLIPTEVQHFLSMSPFPDHLDLYDFLNPFVRQNWIQINDPSILEHSFHDPQVKGNLCLSSCPGKKVRLSGPVRGRATINRDLELDFGRMKSFGITMLVCCLDNEELDFLGAPWPKYEQAAKSHGLKILRLPMIEGSCPSTLTEVKDAILKVNVEINKGNNVLAHCRGGVGRAGLFAACWLLENQLCSTVERAVGVLRERRSMKAIETYTQAEYLVRYSRAMHNIPFTENTELHIPSGIDNFTTPSLAVIAKLENYMIYDPATRVKDDFAATLPPQDTLTPS